MNIAWFKQLVAGLRGPGVKQRRKRLHRTLRSNRRRARIGVSGVETLEERRVLAFAAAVDYGLGAGPIAVVTGDFNGDGKVDLATANFNSSSVGVALGMAGGTFGSATNFAVASGPNSITAGDFNGDGKLDLATANEGSGNLSVLLGTGTGSFGGVTHFALGTVPYSVTTADFNNDGKLDLATAKGSNDSVSILLGNGAGSFGSPTDFAVGDQPHSITVGDFNQDGKLDVAAANLSSNNLSVLLGNGPGTFGAPTHFAVGTSPFSVITADFNLDGKPDLATANPSANNVSVFLGNGTGSFGAATSFAVGANPLYMAVADFNGDGKPDLAASNEDSNSVSVLLGNGAGGFGAATNLNVGSSPREIIATDLNGDGKPDLATTNYSSNNVSVLLNNYPAVSNLPFTAGDVFAASANPSSPVYNITAGGNLSVASPLATLPSNSYGQLAWSADLSTMYATQYNLGTVLAISTSGAVTTFATGINGPMGLIMTSTGKLLVTSINSGNVYDITAGGNFSGAASFATGLSGPRSLLELPSGQIYAVENGSGEVTNITAGGNLSAAVPFANGLGSSHDLIRTSSGQLLVSSSAGIKNITAGGNFSAAPAFATGQSFAGLTVTQDGKILASAFGSNGVFDITAGGNFSGATPFAFGMASFSGELALDTVPFTVPTFTAGDVFAASANSPSFVYDITAGGNLSAATPFATLPSNDYGQIAWSADLTTAYTTQFNTGRVLAITAGGAVTTFATGINGPMGLIVTSAGKLLVGSINTGNVYDITAGGDFSGATPFAFGLTNPRNFLQLPGGQIYVAEAGSGELTDISAGGNLSAATPFANGLGNPNDLVRTSSGQLYVSANGTVKNITAGGNFSAATPFATGQNFAGLTITGTGQILASAFSSNGIWDITAGGNFSASTPFAFGMPGFTGETALDTVSTPVTTAPTSVGVGVAVDDALDQLLKFNPVTGAQLALIPLPSGSNTDAIISPDGLFAYVADFAGFVRVVDLTTNSLASGINAIAVSSPEDLAITPDGKYLLVVDGSFNLPITVIDTTTRTVVSALNEGFAHTGIEVTATGDVLAGQSGVGTRRYTLSPAGVLTFTGQVNGGFGRNMTAAPNGLTAVQTDQGGTVQSFLVSGMTTVSSINTGGGSLAMAFSPDGTRLYVRGGNNLFAYNYNPANGAIGGQIFNVGGLASGPVFFGVDQLDVTAARVYTQNGNGVTAFDALTGVFLGTTSVAGAGFLGIDVVTTTVGATTQLLTNGDFEAGPPGWTVNVTGNGPGFVLDTPGTTTPASLRSTAANGAGGTLYQVSDQTGATADVLFQSFTVPLGATQVILSYQLFANDWDGGPIVNPAGLTLGSGANQHARVDLLTAGAAPFSTAPADIVRNFYLGVDGNGASNGTVHAYTTYSFDITANVVPGQTYKIRFAEVDTNGNLNVGVDNVSILATLPAVTGTLTPALSDGNLTITDTEGTKNNNLSIVVNGSNYVITDPAEQFAGTGGISGAVLSNGNKTLTVPIASITGSQVIINGAGGNDSLLQDLTGGAFAKSIVFNGGSGDDAISFRGNGTQTVTYTPSATTNGDGTVVVNGVSHSFTGLEPADFDNVGTFTLNLPGANDLVTLTNGFNSAITGAAEAVGTVPAMVFSGSSGGVGFEAAHVFRTTNVNVNTTAVAGVDTITVASASNAHLNTNLSITTGAEAGDVINVNGAVSVTGAVSLASVNVNSTAAGTLNTGTGLTVNNTGVASTLAGVISGGGATGLTKTGTGTVTLSGLNTFTGNALINQGLAIAAATSGAAGAFGATNAAATKVQVASGATVDINGQGAVPDFFYGFTLAGTGTSGQGALINSGANGSTGLRQTPNISLSADATIGGTGHIYMINGGYAANSLNLNGFTLTKTGSNTLFLNTTTVAAGTIHIANGTVSQSNFAGPSASNASAANFTLANTAGATLNLGNFPLTIASISGGGATGGGVVLGANTLTVGNGTSTNYAGIISGTGGVTKTGSGTLTLSAVNTFTGQVNVNQGILQAGNGRAFGAFNNAVTKVNVASGGTVDINGQAAGGDFIYGFTLAGTGSSGQGALINNGASGTTGWQQNPNITLAANASIGGTGNIYMINAGYTADTLNLAGFTLTKTGSNTFFLVNTTVTAGTINIASGTISQSNVGSNASAANVTLANTAGATLALGGFNLTIASLAGGGATGGNVTLGGNTLTVGNASSTTYAGAISGTGALLKTGTGTLTLSGNSSYGGGTTISQGTIQSATPASTQGTITLGDVNTGANNVAWLFAGSTTPSNPVVVANQGTGTATIGSYSGGTFTVHSGPITLNRAATFSDATGDRTSFTGQISGNVGLITIAGTRITFDNATNNFLGDLLIPVGTIYQNNANGALPDTTNVTANGTFRLNNSPETINALNGSGLVTNIVGANTLTVGGAGGSGTFTGLMQNGSGALSIVKVGTGTQTLVGSGKTFTGATAVNAGTLELQDTTGFVSAIAVGASGTLNSVRTALGIANRATILGNAITGSGTININNAGSGVAGGWTTVNNSSGLNFSGTININSGVLSRDTTNPNVITGTATVNVAAGAVFGAGRGGNSTIGSLNGAGDVSTVWSGGNAGSLTVGAGNASGTFTGAIRGNGNATDGNIDGGVMSVIKIGSGTQSLGANGYSGATTISQGTLNITHVGTGSNNANVGGNQLTTSALNVSSAALVNLSPGVNFSSANGGTTLSGAGTVRLSSGSWWLGNAGGGTTISMSAGGLIDVQGGTLKNDYANANWSANLASLNVATGANFDLRNNNTVVDTLTGSGNVFDAGYSNSLTLGANGGTGVFTGNLGVGGTTVSLIKINGGTQTLSGAGITYTLATTVSGGTLRFTDTTALNTSIANAATVEINATSGDSWILLAGRTLSGAGTWNKTGSGRATFNNTTLTTSGQFNITQGTLRNNSNSSNWSGSTADMDISSGAILDLYADAIFVNRLTGTGFVQNGYGNSSGQSGASAFIERLVVGVAGGTSTFDGVIRNNATNTVPASATAGGGVQLEKFGAGTTTLTGTNNYSGVTLVTAGTLLVNGTHTGTGAVTASNSAVLGGTGSLAAAVTMNNTSRLSPGVSPETLATGSLTLTSGSFFDVEIGGTAPGDGVTGYDQVNVTGTVSLGNAVLNLQQILGFTVTSGVAQAYTIITNDGSDAVTGIFRDPLLNPLPEGSPIAYAGGTLYVSYAGNDGNDVVLYSQPTVNGGAGNDALVLRQVSGNPALVEFSLNAATFVQVTSGLPFLYNGNAGTDLLLVDTSNGDPISTGNTNFNGELLRVQKNTGAASDTVTYVPTTTAGTGAVNHATFGTINFTQTTNVDFVNLLTANLQTATLNDTLTIADGSTATNGAAVPAGYSIAPAANLSVGGANATIGLRTVGIANLSTVTGGGDGNDVVTIASGAGAHGISNLSVNTGVGTDRIDVVGNITTINGIDLLSQQLNLTGLITGTGAWTANLSAGSGSIADLNGVGTLNVTGAGIVTAIAAGNIELDTSVNTLGGMLSTAGNILIRETNGALIFNVQATVGNVTISSNTGNLVTDTVVAGGTATLTATTGAITDANGGTNNITGAGLVLTAAAGAGSLADPLESAVANLEASGGTGGLFVANAGALTIGGIGGMNGLSATGGDIVVTTTGAMTVSEDVTATGALTDVTLTAIDAAGAGQNLLLSGGATVSSAAASVTLNAGDNAAITGSITSGATTTINVDFGDAESGGPTATAGDGGTLTITGVITTPNTAAGGAFLNGGNDYDTFTFNPQTTTAFYVDGDLPVGGTVGDILQMNVTGTVNPNLTVPGSATVFNGKTYNGPGSGVWTFDPNHREVRFKSVEDAQITGNYHLTYDNSVAPVGTLVVMLDGTANPNEKLQVRDGTTGGTVLYQTTLTPILSVRVLGGAGNDTVTIDDIHGLPSFGGNVPGSTGVGDNPFTSDTGSTAAPEFFFDAGGGTNVLNFNLNAASTQQQYAIGTGTGPGSAEGEVQSTNAATGLNVYFRDVNEVNRTGAGATPGGLTVFGDDLANVISIAANGTESRVAATGYVPFDWSGNNYTSLTVNGQAGNDTLDLVGFGTSQNNSPLITLNGNTDDDTIRVRSTGLAPNANTNTVTLNGNTGNDLFQLFDGSNTVDFIAGPVVVDGTDGNVANNTDTLVIVDSGDISGDSVVVSAVNAGASDEYAVEGINGVGVNDVTFRNIDVLDYTGTADVDTIDGRFVDTAPTHDLNTVTLSGWTGADQFLLFISDQIGGTGANNTPSGTASGVASVSLFGDFPGNPNVGDGHDIFGATHPGIVDQGAMNVGLVVPDSFRLIRPSATTAITIDGGQPTGLAAPLGDVAGDVHNLDISALPNSTPVVVSTFGPGTVVAAGIAPITWSQIEDINLVDQGKLTNVQMGDLFGRTTPGADLIQITLNPTALNPHQVRLRLTATIGNYSASNKTIMYAGGMNDTLTQANLTIPAEFYGEAGDDYLTGATGNDWLVGGIGNDRINGSSGDNVIWGDNAPTNPGDLTPQDGAVGGDDQLSGLGGSDVFYGGAGNDLVSAGGGNDYAYGGLGNDVLDGHDGDDRLYGGAGNDVISGFDGNDLLVGNGDDDRLYGQAGNDVLFGGSGADLIDGGTGNDLLVSGSVGIETSVWTSLPSTSTYSPATYTDPMDNDAALITLLAQWAATSNRGTLGTVPSISHDGQNDDLWGSTGEDDFCWELADVLDNPPGVSPPDFGALGQGNDERFGPM